MLVKTLAEHDAGLTEVIVASQMDAVLATLNDVDFARAMDLNMVFAYEPVWAVGTGKTATPEQVARSCTNLSANASPDAMRKQLQKYVLFMAAV